MTIANKFSVGLEGEKVVILNLPLQAMPEGHAPPGGMRWPAPAPLSCDEAIGLAVWLIWVTGHRPMFDVLLDEFEDLAREGDLRDRRRRRKRAAAAPPEPSPVCTRCGDVGHVASPPGRPVDENCAAWLAAKIARYKKDGKEG